MGAIKAAEGGLASVLVLEASIKTLEKVRISGGGRCNVTNACWDPSDLVPNYPRGQKSLIGAFSRFAAGDAVEWFSIRGLELVVEEDGRLFPKSNSSIDVLNCLHRAASKSGVICLTKKPVIEIKYFTETGFYLKCSDGSEFTSRKVLLATGGSPSGKKLAKQLGHKLIYAVPSIFSFKLSTSALKDCAGITIDNVKLSLTLGEKVFKEVGRVLITHKGLSGPAILRLSAFAARKLFEEKYKASLQINWINDSSQSIKESLIKFKEINFDKSLYSINPFNKISKRLWIYFLIKNKILERKKWSNLSRLEVHKISQFLEKDSNYLIGKGPSGEEFVTAGGISLDQLDFQTMQSKICHNLYFAGEILDVDGVTGGFNFQHCWTSGWIAGRSIAKN